MANRLDARLQTASSSVNNNVPISTDYYTSNSLNYKTYNTPNDEFVRKTASQYDRSALELSIGSRNPMILSNATTTTMYARSVVTDSLNNVYIAGAYRSTVPLSVYNLNNSLTSVGSFSLPRDTDSLNGYIIKFDNNGIARSINVFQSVDVDVMSLSIDYLDSLYCVGRYSTSLMPLYNFYSSSSAAFNSGWVSRFSLPNIEINRCFCVRWNSDGSLYGATIINGLSINEGTRPQIPTVMLANDSQPNLYIAAPFALSASNRAVYNFYTGNSATFSSGWVSTFSLAANTQNVASYIVKYSQTGLAQSWTYIYSSTAGCPVYAYGLVIDTRDNIYLSGLTGATSNQSAQIFNFATLNSDIGAATFSNLAADAGSAQIGFIVKWFVDGVAASRTVLGNIQDYTIYSNVVFDSSSNVYACGLITLTSTIPVYDFSSSLTFVSNYHFPNLTAYAPFIVKFSSAGVVQGITFIRTNQSITQNYAHSMTIDTTDSLYVSGLYSSSATVYNFFNGSSQAFSSGWVAVFTMPAPVITNTFIVKWNSSGTAIIFTTSPINASYSLTDYLVSDLPYIDSDTSNNLNVSGVYVGTLGVYNFSGGASALSYTLFNSPTSSVYYTKYYSSGLVDQNLGLVSIDSGPKIDHSGSLPLVQMPLVASDAEYYSTICADPYNNIYVGFYYVSSTTLPVYDLYTTTTSPVTTYFIRSSGSELQGILLKYSQYGKLKGIVTMPAIACCFVDLVFYKNSLYVGGTYRSNTEVPVYNFSLTGTFTVGVNLPDSLISPGRSNYFIIKYNNDIVDSVAYLTGQLDFTILTYDNVPVITIDTTGKIYLSARQYASDIPTMNVYNFYSSGTPVLGRNYYENATIDKNLIYCWDSGVVSGIAQVGDNILCSSQMITDFDNNLYVSYSFCAQIYDFTINNTLSLAFTVSPTTNTIIIKWSSTGKALSYSAVFVGFYSTGLFIFNNNLYSCIDTSLTIGSGILYNFSNSTSNPSQFTLNNYNIYVIKYTGDVVNSVAFINNAYSLNIVPHNCIQIDTFENLYLSTKYKPTIAPSAIYNFYKTSWITTLSLPAQRSIDTDPTFIVKWNAAGNAISYNLLYSNDGPAFGTSVGIEMVIDGNNNLWALFCYRQTSGILSVNDFGTNPVARYSLLTSTTNQNRNALIKWASDGIVYPNRPRITNIDTPVETLDLVQKNYLNKTEYIGPIDVEYLIVAGGGGGGGGDGGGGGGGGGVLTGSTSLTNTPYTITVGAGGAGSFLNLSAGTSGSNSSAFGLIAIGGGGGGSRDSGVGSNPKSGGSGGGGSFAGGGTGTVGQGQNGGAGFDSGFNSSGGGGGGFSNVGIAGVSTVGGGGGTGTSSSINGSTVLYAGGGGGGVSAFGIFGASGGPGGGGTGGGGGGTGGIGAPGTPNTGGGGGGSGFNAQAGPGGSGIVIVRYAGSVIRATGGTITTISGFVVHTFTSSGTFTPTTSSTGTSIISPSLINRSGIIDATLTSSLENTVNSINVDRFDNIYIAGSFNNTVTYDYLIVGGGGGGGSNAGGGGGGGGVLFGSFTSTSASFSVVVGNGGTAGTRTTGSQGTNGGVSSIFGQTALGGGKGGTRADVGQGSNPPAIGGSCGGAGGARTGTYPNDNYGAFGPSSQGSSGGNSTNVSSDRGPNSVGGGGGGYSQVGSTGVFNDGGPGGNGFSSSITGTLTSYAGGGGGGAFAVLAGTGGTGGGGAGSVGTANATAGSTNTGGGGGGGGDNTNAGQGTGGSGGSGIVIVSYRGPRIATGGTITQYTGINGLITVHTFTSSGTLSLLSTINPVQIYNRDGTSSFVLPSINGSYVIKFNQRGLALGYTVFENMSNVYGIPDNLGTLYVSGYLSATTNVYNFSNNNNLGQFKFIVPRNNIIVKFSTSGYAISYVNFNGLNFKNMITFDTFNNAYYASRYVGSQNVFSFSEIFGSQTFRFLAPNFGTASVVVQYLSTGVAAKFTALGITTAVSSLSVSALTIDAYNNLYVAGVYNPSTSLDLRDFSTSSTLNNRFRIVGTTGSQDAIFVIKWTQNNIVSSAAIIRRASTLTLKTIRDIKTDVSGSVYLTGTYRETQNSIAILSFITALPAVFDPALFLPTTSITRAYIAVWSNNGMPIAYWFANNLEPSSLTVDSNIYLTGYYNNTSATTAITNFYTNTREVITTTSFLPITISDDMFVIKWALAGTTIAGLNTIRNGTGISSMSDGNGSFHLVGTYKGSATTTSITDFYLTSTTARFSYFIPTTVTSSFYIKWIDTGVADLGSYTQPCYITLPNQTLGSFSTTTGVINGYNKQLVLSTPNYLYNISFPDSSNSYSSVVVPYGVFPEFIYNGNGYTYTGQNSSQAFVGGQQSANLSLGLISRFEAITSFANTNPVVNTFSNVLSYGLPDQIPTGTTIFTIRSAGTYQLSSQFMYLAPALTTFSLTMAGTSAFSEVSPASTANWISGSIYRTFEYGQTLSVSSQVSASPASCSMAGTTQPCLFSIVKMV